MCRRICSLKGYKKNKQLRKVLTYDNEVLIAQFPKLFLDLEDLDCYKKKYKRNNARFDFDQKTKFTHMYKYNNNTS